MGDVHCSCCDVESLLLPTFQRRPCDKLDLNILNTRQNTRTHIINVSILYITPSPQREPDLIKNIMWQVCPLLGNGREAIINERCVLQLLVAANVVPTSPIFVTLIIETICSFKIWLLQEPHGATVQKMIFISTRKL
jgi:hypothetical protein